MQATLEKQKIRRVHCGALAACMLFPLLGSCFGSCDVYTNANAALDGVVFSVASWNVQALFDGQDNGWEYEEYRDGSGWTEDKYTARLTSIAKAIDAIGEKRPEAIAFIEVENSGVLEKLRNDYLGKQGYKHVFFAGNPGNSLGIGVLSRKPFSKTMAHSINVEGEVIPRPISEVWFDINGQALVVFICHWKSKLGGEESTERLRREAARVIIRRQRELMQENPEIPLVVLGDLNENFNEFYRQGSEYICALLPDDPEAARKTGYAVLESVSEDTSQAEALPEPKPQDFLILSNEKPPETAFFNTKDGIFYSPWGNEIQNGSYFYDGGWETIDHILLNTGLFNKKGLKFKNCYVLDSEPFVNSKGEPDRYNPRTGSGLSDHLPLLLTLGL